MATKTIAWDKGDGNITITYDGSGNGTIVVTSSDNNLFEERSKVITVSTTAGSPQQTKTITIVQEARAAIDISSAVVTAANQTYTGSALTPSVTVTLNGETVPPSGYDVSYSNNTNAGTATITVTGKGNYTNSASGSFTIAQATGQVTTAPTANTMTYSGSAQYLVTAGSGTGTIYYSYRYKSYSASSWGSWSTASTTRPSRTNAGYYEVRYYAAASSDGNYTQSATGTVSSIEIQKATPTYIAPTKKTGLTYTGSAQALLNAGSTSHGTFYYSTNNSTWSTSIPTQTNANTSGYTVYWKLTGDSNHSDVASTTISGITIAQATGSVTTAPTARSVTYTGSSQYLVTAGSGTGTMYYRYKLSTASSYSSWSTTRPSATTAGTYNVEYYCAASSDGNYSASSTGSLNVAMAKASRTISFSDVYNVVAPSGTITKTATPSAGSGDGAVTYSISSTTYATINSSTGKVTAKTSEGSATVTATVTEGTNYLSSSATYTLYVFATTHNFDYTGSVQSLSLPPGSYKLETWGAQGGSNAAASSYSITAQSGGKGGYSTGQLTLASAQTVYAFVGGQGSSSGNGGWNGGGGGSGSSSYNSGDTNGVSRMGCGGGATDIALTTSTMSYSSYRTNRSSASLLSRMIVAGGGSGGAMCYKAVTTSSTSTMWTFDKNSGMNINNNHYTTSGKDIWCHRKYRPDWDITEGDVITLSGDIPSNFYQAIIYFTNGTVATFTASSKTYTVPQMSDYSVYYVDFRTDGQISSIDDFGSLTLTSKRTTSSTTTSTSSQVGYVGGGTSGGGYSDTYKGRQSAAGTDGGFGYGANQTSTGYRYCSACGGGGWYGGGSNKSDSTTTYVKYSGGGSGFVNTSASSSSRPSGYTGLQLDSGSTYDGSQTFKAPSGSNETGHSGNGYARITRL